MNNLWQNFSWTAVGQWSAFVAFLFLLLYTGFVVKNEKDSFHLHAREYLLGSLRLFVPHWWSCVSENPEELVFARLDTRYDWQVQFSWHSHSPHSLSTMLEKKLLEWQVVFDPDPLQQTEMRGLFHPHFYAPTNHHSKRALEVLRVEGTGTMEHSERIYLDVTLVRVHDHNHEKILLVKNLSSVLNGSVEGPYVEEVMKKMEWMEQS